MRDYWLVQYVLNAIGLGYVIVTLVAVGLVLWLAKTWQSKINATLVVLAVASIFPILGINEYRQQRQAADEYKARYAKAKALFDERCKTAGEQIYRTVEDVESVFLMNMRPERVSRDAQFERYDPYGYEGGGRDYIKAFLGFNWTTCVDAGPKCSTSKRAFQYVEWRNDKDELEQYRAVDGKTGKPFTKDPLSFAKLVVAPITTMSARYGVQWADISTDDDRKYWIAGGEIKIVDLKTNEIIAVRRGYLMDTGLGNTGGDRQPWAWARNYTQGCPPVENHNFTFTRSVLKPIQGE